MAWEHTEIFGSKPARQPLAPRCLLCLQRATSNNTPVANGNAVPVWPVVLIDSQQTRAPGVKSGFFLKFTRGGFLQAFTEFDAAAWNVVLDWAGIGIEMWNQQDTLMPDHNETYSHVYMWF